eukprot:TRINITY_DN13179_c0_g1_i1.p3 TRINITY_DN13179_c0_g1~~TRINITY_DN13179_c0_g1_i1.p3  ORF type:complete len:141 (+),score=26.05 TRINITY_DN13179_c0_g1_i1:29-424(+)
MRASISFSLRQFQHITRQNQAPQLGRQLTVRTMAQQAVPKFHILEYKYVPDILEKRAPFRDEHIAAAKKLGDEGKAVMVGAYGQPPEGAIFVFKGITPEEIESFVKSDPYIINGLVTEWQIKPYLVVVGDS